MESSGEAGGQGAGHGAERHASWLELFFDLVAVAGVGQLAHLLHGHLSLLDVAMYVVLYLAFWNVWAAFTMYGNVAGDQARLGPFVLAMLGLGVMVAAVAEVRAGHAVAFALAYVLLRWLAGRVWRPGQVLVDWPIAQLSAGTVPWIVSLWVAAPGRYWLWALGLALDLWVMLTLSGDRVVARMQEQLDRRTQWRHERRRTRARAERPPRRERPARERAERGPARRRPGRPAAIDVVAADAPHLGERLGLLVIIVLGEGVIQITSAASEAHWDADLAATAVGGFLLLVGVWALSLRHGHAGVPHLRQGQLPAQPAMALHCAVTGVIAALAAGLGAATAHATGVPEGDVRWLLCATVAAYFALALLGGVLTRAGWRWILGWALPAALVPLALGGFGDRIQVPWLVGALTVLVYIQLRREIARPGQALAA